jgi:biopolymer transport protein ExbD
MRVSQPTIEAKMDMTPMIDVVFQLIIFFMLITDMTQKELEDLVLPVARSAIPDKPEPDDIRPILNVMSDGRIIVKKNVVYDPKAPDEFREVAAYLADHADKMRRLGHMALIDEKNPASGMAPDDPLLIRADNVTEFALIQQIMAVCGQKGIQIWKVELAASEDEEAARKRQLEAQE